MTITTAELKKNLEKYLELAETDPVIIENMGCMKSVVISYTMYERLTELEDAYWGERAERAEAEGYLGEEASESLLNRAGTDCHV
ncbi:type II toxin-antitoxin system prevent-host-death family antitoxin [Desulfococcaceae bacterium HSG8]|nr:type II toxin-antitoxin system prevent-host-death family antitoxin [Desulfococcaceae bacterium HSG8]